MKKEKFLREYEEVKLTNEGIVILKVKAYIYEYEQGYLKCAHCNKEIEAAASYDGMPFVEGKVCSECNEHVLAEIALLSGEYR